jgi:hypothetical protein
MGVSRAEAEKDGQEIITYRCTTCGMETERHSKRQY